MSIELVMPSNHLTLCHPLLLPPSIFRIIRIFSNESAPHIRWPTYWSFSFNISSSNEYSGLIPLGLAGLISLRSKGLSTVFSITTVRKHQLLVLSVLYDSALTSTHDYWKNHSLTLQAFVSKVRFLLFNTLSRFVIVLLPRNKRLLISGLQSLLSWASKSLQMLTAATKLKDICSLEEKQWSA